MSLPARELQISWIICNAFWCWLQGPSKGAGLLKGLKLLRLWPPVYSNSLSFVLPGDHLSLAVSKGRLQPYHESCDHHYWAGVHLSSCAWLWACKLAGPWVSPVLSSCPGTQECAGQTLILETQTVPWIFLIIPRLGVQRGSTVVLTTLAWWETLVIAFNTEAFKL